MSIERRSRLDEYTILYDMILDVRCYLEKLETRIKLLRIQEKSRAEQRNNKSNKKGKS